MNIKLTRTADEKVVGGVCAGLAKNFGMDVSIVRLITVLLAVFTQVGWVVYIALWMILPEESSGGSGFDELKDTFGNKTGNDQSYQQYPGRQDGGPQDPPAAS